jgi:hypothetical protein
MFRIRHRKRIYNGRDATVQNARLNPRTYFPGKHFWASMSGDGRLSLLAISDQALVSFQLW